MKVLIDQKALGERIKGLRIQQGYTQQQLGELSDVSPSFISNLETGTQSISVNTLLRISNALGVTPNLILREYIDEPLLEDQTHLEQVLQSFDEYEQLMAEDLMKHFRILQKKNAQVFIGKLSPGKTKRQ